MACALTQGHTPKVCKSVAGVKEILIAELANVNLSAMAKTAGVVTTLTCATGKQFFIYKQKAETANWKQSGAADPKMGTKSQTQTITLDVLGFDQATQTELELLLSNSVVCIVKLNDGTYWLVGEDYGLDVTTMEGDSGTAMGDFMGDKITITGKTILKAASVNSGLIATLTAPAV